MKEKQRNSSGFTPKNERTDAIIKKHKKFARWKSTVVILAIAVLLSSGYSMILPATTMSQQAYCGHEEHVHTDACFEQHLICTGEEAHEHGEECYRDVQTCICDQEESEEGHTHSDECYETEKELSCTVDGSAEAHKHTDGCYEKVLVCKFEEHTHQQACFSNPEADLESPSVWERSVNDVKLTGVWADDIVNIAESQLGYKESQKNYIVDEEGNLKGYTRYGAWYGDAYADWSELFVSFCMNYAEISEDEMPRESDSASWAKSLDEKGLYETTEDCAPQKGDLIFFSTDEKSNGPDHVGIIADVINDKAGNLDKLQVIEGDAENEVVKTTYGASDSRIVGYGVLPQNPDAAGLQSIPAKARANASTLATGDTYVGFSKAASTGAVDFANGGGGGGVRKYYLAPKSVYNQYSTSSAYSLQQKLIAQSEVAYCFNFHNDTPYTVYESKTYSSRPYTFYNEKENASASLFYNNTTYPRNGYSQNALYQKILTVALNGYPNNYSSIQSKYGLTADEFRFITQYAIWYYTDSISLRFSTYHGQPQFCVNNDRTGECLTLHSYTQHGSYNANSSNIKAAYEELINSTLDIATVSTSHINLYKPQNGSSQNLLTVGREDAPPQQEPNRLRLMKNVSGTAADPEQEFTFTIQMRNSSFSSVSGTYTVIPDATSGVAKPNITSIRFSNGTATVKLKHGQSITIDGLPDNFYYTILETEANQGGYTTTVTEGQNSNMQSGDGGSGTVPVTFNNHKDAPSTITKIQIPAKKTIDNGKTTIGDNRFTFKLTGNGQELYADSDENGNILFPEIIYTQPGTYTYTIEEVTDERDGVSFDFDKSRKTVTVTINSQAVQTFDPDAVYYAFEELSDDYQYYYYVDTVPGKKGIVMYCTYQSESGPQDPTGYTKRAAKDQTYKVVLNPTVSQITANNWVQQNIYGDALTDNLKKLFYYFETDDAKNISNSDKQSLVWTATGKTSSISSIRVNGKPASSNATTVLNNIYETVSPPSSYNLAFFVPTGTQAVKYPQPLATGYGAQIDETIDEVSFNNTTKAQNSLKLEKTVTGTAGDTNQEFNFTISLMDSNWQGLNGSYNVTSDAITGITKPNISSIKFTNGTATVKLKHGQNIKIEGLPNGFYYSISEAEWNQNGYTSSVTKGSSSNMTTSGATGAVDVEFRNHKDAPSPPPSYKAEIKAKKTLDGERPADGQFTFILRNAQGEEIDRKTNDAKGEVTFPLTITEAGTYTYTVEELNDHQQGIVYDTEVKTVTVTVTSETLEEIVDSNSFVGSHVSDDFYITVNGTTQLDVYCIDGSAGYPSGNYNKVFNPTTAELAGQVTANNYGNALAENMRKLLYYFDTHSDTDKIGYTTLTKEYRQELIWCLTGNSGQQHWTYTDNLNTILAESNPPDNYTVVMFASTGNAQPVIAGYLPEITVEFEGNTGSVEFANRYGYELPETGGRGTTGYTLGGMLILCSAVVLMYIYKLERRKGGRC